MKSTLQINISDAQLALTLALGFLFIVAAVFFGLDNELENELIISQNGIVENAYSASIFQAITSLGMPFISICYVILLFWSNRANINGEDCTLFFLVIISFGLVTLIGDIGKEIIGRPRPAMALGNLLLQQEIPTTPSMPSGHAAKSFALALPFALLSKRKDIAGISLRVLLVLVALMVGYSRMALQKHYLSDILAGEGLAMIVLPLAVIVTNTFYLKKNIDEAKLSVLNSRLWFIFIALTILLYLL